MSVEPIAITSSLKLKLPEVVKSPVQAVNADSDFISDSGVLTAIGTFFDSNENIHDRYVLASNSQNKDDDAMISPRATSKKK